MTFKRPFGRKLIYDMTSLFSLICTYKLLTMFVNDNQFWEIHIPQTISLCSEVNFTVGIHRTAQWKQDWDNKQKSQAVTKKKNDDSFLLHCLWLIKDNKYLPHKVKTQYLHFRSHAEYFLLSWKNHEVISRRSILFHNQRKYLVYQT